MSTITFENDDKTQKILVDIIPEGEGAKVTVTYEPKIGDQDKKSIHWRLADRMIGGLAMGAEIVDISE